MPSDLSMNLPPIILASTSPRRSELLRELVADFTVFPGNATEVSHEHLSPHELAQLNAYRKARAVAKKYPDALVLGADTIVCLGNKIFGKPANLEEARRTLRQLQGKTHQVVTGVCLAHLRSHQERLFAAGTDVVFRRLSDEQINDYLARINPLDKAGSYAIQQFGDLIVENISGSFSNVVGLPLERLREELAAWNSVPA